MLAIIGGTGLTQLANMNIERREIARTPYGEPSGVLLFGRICNQRAVFLARHGYGHTIPPHKVNYRANLWAIKEAGATGILSVASVGGIRADLGPGTLVVPHQIIDYTWGRESTYFEELDRSVVHIDFTNPYDELLRQRLLAAAHRAGEPIVDGAVYGATQGPRLETAAEINRLEWDGVDVVGMTGMPEAALARELELPYAALNVVANWAAGRAESRQEICFTSIEGTLQQAMGKVRQILEHVCEV
ncbi:MAG: S-methyl-5'-thioinosine phosphorylase [Betaproteobacteria bacterium]|nr:S-methyl-5'-thioinosine phosphorylase [Betaproteobacteria bacterium]